MNKEKNSADIFKEVLDDLGFSGYKPHQMTNSDYWLCTTKAMEVYAKYTTSLKSSPTDEEIEKQYPFVYSEEGEIPPYNCSQEEKREAAKWARDYKGGNQKEDEPDKLTKSSVENLPSSSELIENLCDLAFTNNDKKARKILEWIRDYTTTVLEVDKGRKAAKFSKGMTMKELKVALKINTP